VTEIASAATSCFSLFAFSLPLQILLGQVLDLTPTLPVSLIFPVVGGTMSRRASEVLKGDGKPKMTLCDGLRISRRDRYSGAFRSA
jgi:hypothetical protein